MSSDVSSTFFNKLEPIGKHPFSPVPDFLKLGVMTADFLGFPLRPPGEFGNCASLSRGRESPTAAGNGMITHLPAAAG